MVTRRFAPWRLYTSAECASLVQVEKTQDRDDPLPSVCNDSDLPECFDRFDRKYRVFDVELSRQ